MPASLQKIAPPPWILKYAPNSSLYRLEDCTDFIKRLGSWLDSVEIYMGFPEKILEIDDALITPGKPTVWTRTGDRIPESCVRRGPNLSQYVWAGDEKLDFSESTDYFNEECVYLSFLPNEWGHFLLESTSRLWALNQNPALENLTLIYGYEDFRNDNILKFFEYAGIKRSRFRKIERPTRIKRCLIPSASFSIRAEAYSAHHAIFKQVAQAIMASRRTTKSDQPIYLSRSNITRGRVIRGELELEERLIPLGIKVVHPETMSFEQQVELFNTHSHFIGCWGSAFHNILFAIEPEELTTHIMCEDVPNPNYLMIDSILMNRSNYLQALRFTPSVKQEFPKTDCTIDANLLIDYLKQKNLI